MPGVGFGRWGHRRSQRETVACKETPAGVEPASTALQAVAWPSGSSVVTRTNVPTRNRTWSTTFARSRASFTLRGQFTAVRIPHRGVEPRPTASKAVMRPSHSRGVHSSGPTAGFAPASSGLRNRRFSQSATSASISCQRSAISFQQATARGFEPRGAALEAACSPRSTPLHKAASVQQSAISQNSRPPKADC